MSFKGKLAQILIIIVIVAASLALVSGLWKKSHQVRQEAQNSPVAEEEMKLKDMEFTEMQEGKRYWTLHATEAKYFQDQQRTLLQTVHLILYLEKTNEQIDLVSDEGVLYAGTKNIDLRGNVRAVLPREYVMTTQTAHYNHDDRIVQSDDPIHISGPGLELDGNRWKYKIANHVANVDGKVKASLVVGALRIEK